MLFGAQLPGNVPATGAGELLAFVRELEDYGIDAFWTSDHVVIPEHVPIDADYPYAWRYEGVEVDDLFPDKSHFEVVATLGFLAAATTTARIGVAVVVAPMRNAVLTAKQLATLDYLSDGRLIAGFGAGWMRREFEALGADYEQRGRLLDEQLEVMQALWSGEPVHFVGEFHRLDGIYCLPRPVQGDAFPVWIGGHSKAALRRCARFGNGWIASEVDPEGFAKASADLDAYLVERGREPESVKRVVTTRLRLAGDLREAEELVAAYAHHGCEHIVVTSTPSRGLAENADRFRRLVDIGKNLT